MPERPAVPVPMRSFRGTTVRDTYLLQELIGEGNFGGVFLSEQQFLGEPIRRVAVKLSKHIGLDVSTARDMFSDAFILARAMDEMADVRARSHLVHLYDVGVIEPEGRGFVAMEYVQGTTLAAQFESFERVPAPQLIKWATQICTALAALHRLPTPVVHRDLKPDNVLLGTDLAVRVVDFGLAARLLAHGVVPGVAGTVAYMAPETSQGRSTPASDVYSIGLILYEGLTGKLPFAHLVPPLDLPHALHTDWLFDKKATVRAVPPSSRSNTSTPGLDAVVLRCVAFDPARRYQDAGELLQDLELLGGPAPKPSAELRLEEARRLRAGGDLAGAGAALRAGVAAAPLSPEVRFALLRELGQVMGAADDHAAAADALLSAWEETSRSVVLRSREERAALLDELAGAYAAAGNHYQAGWYGDLARAERSGTGGRIAGRA